MAPALDATLHAPALPRRASWIISPREDALWFIGASLAGYAAILLMWLGVAVLPLQLVWLLIVDGPHVVSTVTRTYFDRAERQRLGWFLWIVVPLAIVGPAMVLAGQAALFFLAAFCWQQHHVVKQHLGFVMIYKAKNRERDPIDRTLDRMNLFASLFAPLAIFVVRTQPLLEPVSATLVTMMTTGAYAVVAMAWLLRQVVKLAIGAEMNWPKLWLLAVTVPLQWLALGFAERFGAAGTLQAAIPLGLFHGLQYHRLIWFHNRNRYSGSDARERNGFAAVAASHVGVYIAVALGLNFAITVMLPLLAAPLTPDGGTVALLVPAALWGIAFTHYCLDARIWRVRHDRELAAVLHLG